MREAGRRSPQKRSKKWKWSQGGGGAGRAAVGEEKLGGDVGGGAVLPPAADGATEVIDVKHGTGPLRPWSRPP